MSKKIILLALAAASVAAFALPATAMAAEEDVPVHVKPAPIGTKNIDGEGSATLTGGFGSVVCPTSHGTITFENGTTGTFEQTFGSEAQPCELAGAKCTTSGSATGVITTKQLPFHLVTVEDSSNGAKGPGVLVTPNGATGEFASFTCGFLGFTVKGNGVIGTITRPACSGSSNEPTISFSSSSTGVQTHRTVVGTPNTEYTLTNLGSNASEDASGIITMNEPTEPTLECT